MHEKQKKKQSSIEESLSFISDKNFDMSVTCSLIECKSNT